MSYNKFATNINTHFIRIGITFIKIFIKWKFKHKVSVLKTTYHEHFSEEKTNLFN